MIGVSRRWLGLGTVLVLLAAGFLVPVREDSIQVPAHTANAGELVDEVLVGQTFVAERDNLSAVSIMFATYSGRDNTQPVEFHLRERVGSDEDIRTGIVDPSVFGDNQFYRFDFEPIADSAGATYFFFVRSPGSTVGNAVTVDLRADDSYHRGSAYIARGAADTYDAALIERSGKPTVDVVFGAAYSVSAAAAGWHAARDAVQLFVTTWDERRSEYYVWGLAAAMAVGFVGLAITVGRVTEQRFTPRFIRLVLGSLLALAVLVRLLYAVQLPLTNDEGNYLYDAQSLLHGRLAGGDGYVKALIVVLWLSVWQGITGPTILAGRLAAIVASALTAVPLYAIGRQLAGKRAGLLAAGAWALLAAPAVTGIYVHTQPLALLLGTGGIAVLLLAFRDMMPAIRGRMISAGWWLFLGGVLLGLGAVSRKSVVSLGLVVVWLILTHGGSWRRKAQATLLIGAGFALVVSALLIFAHAAYGPIGIREALGINSAADGREAVEPGQEEQVRAYSLRGMTPFFRESLPLILLAVLGLGAVLEALIVRTTRRLSSANPSRSFSGAPAAPSEAAASLPSADGGGTKPKSPQNPRERLHRRGAPFTYLYTKVIWLLPLAAFWWAWGFFMEYEGEAVMAWGMRSWWGWAAAALVAAAAVLRLREPLAESGRRQLLSAAAVPLLWLTGMAFLYLNWIKFHANYLIEFLPPLALLAGIGAAALAGTTRVSRSSADAAAVKQENASVRSVRRLAVAGVMAVLLWGAFASGYVTYTFPHTGTFEQAAVREAAAWAREHIPPDEPIFTGAALIPYLSGHRTVLDIAHPRWYAYTFIWQQNPERLAAFLTSREEMLDAYRQAEWFLLEKQTGFSFLMEYSEIEAGLEADWERVHGISNGSNTMTFYKRKH